MVFDTSITGYRLSHHLNSKSPLNKAKGASKPTASPHSHLKIPGTSSPHQALLKYLISRQWAYSWNIDKTILKLVSNSTPKCNFNSLVNQKSCGMFTDLFHQPKLKEPNRNVRTAFRTRKISDQSTAVGGRYKVYHYTSGRQNDPNMPAKNIKKRLKQYKRYPSWVEKGNGWDSAPVERFFRSFKSERPSYCKSGTQGQARIEMTDYISSCNSDRLPSTLGCDSYRQHIGL